MKPIYSIVLAAALVGSIGFAAVSQGPNERERAQAARILEGREAGPPVICVSQNRLRGNHSLDENSILFGEQSDGVVYVNRPRAGCAELNSSRTLVTHSTTGQLCSGDIVSIREPGRGPPIGACNLGEFTPYRRVR